VTLPNVENDRVEKLQIGLGGLQFPQAANEQSLQLERVNTDFSAPSTARLVGYLESNLMLGYQGTILHPLLPVQQALRRENPVALGAMCLDGLQHVLVHLRYRHPQRVWRHASRCA
jgi:hypothetical protein